MQSLPLSVIVRVQQQTVLNGTRCKFRGEHCTLFLARNITDPIERLNFSIARALEETGSSSRPERSLSLSLCRILPACLHNQE